MKQVKYVLTQRTNKKLLGKVNLQTLKHLQKSVESLQGNYSDWINLRNFNWHTKILPGDYLTEKHIKVFQNCDKLKLQNQSTTKYIMYKIDFNKPVILRYLIGLAQNVPVIYTVLATSKVELLNGRPRLRNRRTRNFQRNFTLFYGVSCNLVINRNQTCFTT